jgi:translation machinery-associated protein 16
LDPCLVDKYVFFFHAIPDDKDALSLEELHAIIKDVWLTRLDSQLEEERQSRRKGRPKTTKEVKLETLKEVELEEYRTGMGEQSPCKVRYNHS